MRIFSFEHSKIAYRADFALYLIASAILAICLITFGPQDQTLSMTCYVLSGIVSWTLIEYVLHRFVLHGLKPFSQWHAEHHRHPDALICTPTIISAALIIGLVFLPMLVLSDIWSACALTFGLLTGYLVYTITHHAIHHWHVRGSWLEYRIYFHAIHHSRQTHRGNFGVTSSFWDQVFRTK
ncbi:sterol desaturase family protein [Undibacterium sp. Rencai35W]|uniref:sterol desaturase family protein n=1 Tax=Undibacterium sp. Rencai35W TaxID=3413046 RepID=UPI003BF25977